MEFEAMLALASVGAGFMMLTVVGATVIAATTVIAWFFGRAALMAALSAASGLPWLVICWRDGSLATCLSHYWRAYEAVALHRVWSVWLSAWSDLLAWQTLPSVALIFSSIAILLNEDRLNSPIRRLLRGQGISRTAPWIRFIVHKKLKEKDPAGQDAVLGVDAQTGDLVSLPLRSLQKHVIAAGRSGSGKSTSLTTLIAWALKMGYPATVINGKGDSEFGDRLTRIAAEYGRPVYRVDMHDEAPRCCYAPLANKNYTIRADMIVGLRDVYTEEHYQLLQTEHAQTTFRVLESLGVDVDLASLPEFMSSDALLRALRRSGRRADYQEIANSIMAMQAAERAGIDSLRASVTNLANSSYGAIFDTKMARAGGRTIFDLQTARTEGALTYFGVPSLLMPTAAKRFTNLIINDVKATLAGATTPWLICFDELSSVGPQITNIVNQGRSHGAMCLLGCQSFSDLKLPADPDFIHRVIASVNTFVLHAMADPEDTELAAKIIGTHSLVELTAQLQGDVPTGAASARSVREFKFHPDILKSGRVGEATVVDKDRGRVFGPVLIRATHL